jgi:hypothetical protein
VSRELLLSRRSCESSPQTIFFIIMGGFYSEVAFTADDAIQGVSVEICAEVMGGARESAEPGGAHEMN